MAISVVFFSFSRAAQPEAQGLSSLLDNGFLYCILSPTGLQNSIGGPEGPFGREWLSLPHLISNFSGPQLIRGPNSIGGPEGLFGLAWLSLPHLVSNSNWSLTPVFLSSQSYIIIQRPLNRPLNPWNGMFDRHQAEITVMQFRGHTLTVHQSMSVSWVLPCPISSAKSADAISFDYWPLECVTSFRCITLEWHVCPGRRSKYNT